MKHKLNFLMISIVLFVLFSCKTTKQAEVAKNDKNKNVHTTKTNEHKTVHWSHHKGEEGPENWKNISDKFSDCGGETQSPINIETTKTVLGKDLKTPIFSYQKSKVEIVNNGHTVQFNVFDKNEVVLHGKTYRLLQFHYHATSEHTVDGKYYPLEVHFVHKYSDTDFAVIGAFIKEGRENLLFNKYLTDFPIQKGTYKVEENLDILSLLPNNKSYYNYNGSLTTPPCSEVVNWFVLKNPITASKEQITVISKILNKNFRPITPTNERKITLFEE